MIKIRGLRKFYGGVPVLDGIDLDIEAGQHVVIIGPSGTGKSTLLRCINFLDHADEGTISIGSLSVDVSTATPKQIKALRLATSFIFQNYALFANKTARANIAEGLMVVRGWSKAEANKRADDLLQMIGLGDKGDAYPVSLSGGQQQRVGIGRAIAADTQLMLIDEPTSALDPEWVDEVLQLLKRIADENRTMLVVTHEMSFARQIADKVVFMEGGKIVEQGPPEQMFTSPVDPRTRHFLRKTLGTM
ncbi:amino acid ABC transporter ATP-binding protein [Rhodobacteraceae bacterium RKSG542]|uniref:amino acid ABC transporter ATP-binding protein n=1 Tax=Pseudovibrio flavus TaxID=2529854 RepID=UPI0012BBEA8B|nr:amino acid ABC transporter ATP-binding protein [Pseudovibrio flavus]MTI17487.1 amino acid ABC transporter ATP-binding protein [Pseudovibrio flavus]